MAAIGAGGLLDTLQHPNRERYPRQRLFVVALRNYAYVVPYVEQDDESYFLKTVYPSRAMTRKYLRQE